MSRIIIKTRKEGEMSFWCKEGGGFRGSTLSASEKTLGGVARKWLRQRREAERKAMA